MGRGVQSQADAIARVVRNSTLPDSDLAEAFGITDRHVRRLRAPVRRRERELKLRRAMALAGSRVTAGVLDRESA